MNKKQINHRFVYVITILITILYFGIGLFLSYFEEPGYINPMYWPNYFFTTNTSKGIREFQCKLMKGRVVNTLDFFDENTQNIRGPFCKTGEYSIPITGLLCPCVCCL